MNYKVLIEEWNNKIKSINELSFNSENNEKELMNNFNIVDFNENIKTLKKK